MYKLMRHFSLASLAGIVLATFLITLIYRQMAINGITALGEKINVELAHTALSPVKPQLLNFLASVRDIDEPGTHIPPLNIDLAQNVRDVMEDTAVIHIKIYNRHGIVVFSTKPDEVGRSQLEAGDRYENRGFRAAVRGREANKLVYVDALNVFTTKSEDQNMMQTYLPLRRSITAPVEGVFEIYTDAQPLVDYAQYTQLAVAGVTATIMALLYLTLLMVVRRAEKTIESQQNIIRDRTETLELLSAQLLTAQEVEKARLADVLHEDIAQTLSAIQFQAEHSRALVQQQQPGEYSNALAAIISSVQDALRKVRAMAMELRPPSLDDLGVIATLHWYLREYQSHHPETRVQTDITIGETDVSRALKVIIYRLVQEMLDNLARYAAPSAVRVTLTKSNQKIALFVEDSGWMYQHGNAAARQDSRERIWMQAIEERAVLSGAIVTVQDKGADGHGISFTWDV